MLIPTLCAALDAGRRADLHQQARHASPDRIPTDLANLWTTFLELVAAAVEQGAKLEWYWEETGTLACDGPYRVFTASGIFAYLDDDMVRTGFLPFKDDLPAERSERVRGYELFARCWEKVQQRYQRAVQEGRLVQASTALLALMRKVPDLVTWEHLK